MSSFERDLRRVVAASNGLFAGEARRVAEAIEAAQPEVEKTMTEQEWQECYEITSLKGRIWKRSEIRKRSVEMLKSLLPPGSSTPIARRTAVQLVLDDPSFMRGRKGMVPARVIGDAAIEAMLRMMREAK